MRVTLADLNGHIRTRSDDAVPPTRVRKTRRKHFADERLATESVLSGDEMALSEICIYLSDTLLVDRPKNLYNFRT